MTAKTEMPELKPCPFCGSDGLIYHSRDGEVAFVRCVKWLEGCMGASVTSTEDVDAIKQWNARATSPDLEGPDAVYVDHDSMSYIDSNDPHLETILGIGKFVKYTRAECPAPDLERNVLLDIIERAAHAQKWGSVIDHVKKLRELLCAQDSQRGKEE